jgi:hypothetical protein
MMEVWLLDGLLMTYTYEARLADLTPERQARATAEVGGV